MYLYNCRTHCWYVETEKEKWPIAEMGNTLQTIDTHRVFEADEKGNWNYIGDANETPRHVYNEIRSLKDNMSSGGGGGASEQYVDDKIVKMMAWTNYIGYLGQTDPATIPEIKAEFFLGSKWYKGTPGVDTVFPGWQWLGDGENLGWADIGQWTIEPQDVASWRYVDETDPAKYYAVLAFEDWRFTNTINPLA